MYRPATLLSHAQAVLTGAPLSAADAALVATIYQPPRARRPWMFKEILPVGATRYYSLARWALVDALRACGVGRGDRVLLPELICREVMASVSTLGASAAFYPVSRQLRGEVGDAHPAKAVLAVNYFGFPQELDAFRRYCERAGAALIEDNAHGLLSRDAAGRLLGGCGDAAIFSFRKTVPVPGGAALVLRRVPSGLPDSPPPVRTPCLRYRLKQRARAAAMRLGPRRSARLIEGFLRLRQSLSGRSPSLGAPDVETRIPATPNPPAMVALEIRITDPQLEARRRRSLYALVASIAVRAGATPVFAELPAHTVPYGFPFFASPAQAPAIRAHLARHGLAVASWPDLPSAVAASAPDHYRTLMVVPFLW